MAKVSLTTLWNDFYAWIARKDNPHQVTASQAGAYAKAEIESLLSGYVPAGVIPMSRFGNASKTELGVSIAASDGNCEFNISADDTDVLLSGRFYQLQKTKWSFTVAKGSTLYLYVKRDPSLGVKSVYIEAVSSPRAETPTSFYVGSVAWAASDSVCKGTMFAVTMIGAFRISTEPVGSAIPASSGMSTETGTFKW